MKTAIIYKPKNTKITVLAIFFRLLFSSEGRKHLWKTFWR
jgi:hypothetical protein